MCAALFGLPSCSDYGDIAQEGTGAPIGTDRDLVLVDITAGTVTNLGLPATQYSVALAAATAGRRRPRPARRLTSGWGPR